MKVGRIAISFLVVLLLANLIAWAAIWQINPRYLEVTFLNVGQGDAILVETPAGHQIIIDGGPDNSVLEKLSERMPFYDRTIEAIILTHPDSDHLTGLLEIFNHYEVQNVIWTGVVRDTPQWKEWVKLLAEEESHIFYAKQGLELSSFRGRHCNSRECFTATVLYPVDDMRNKNMGDRANDSSVVVRAIYGDTSFLFTGDISSKVEKEMVGKVNLDSNILKIPHHGSRYSSSEGFLSAVSPAVAVISLGKNNYGHPAPEVLEKLERSGIRVMRTDVNGDVKIISDGTKIQISSSNN